MDINTYLTNMLDAVDRFEAGQPPHADDQAYLNVFNQEVEKYQLELSYRN